jgi:outer membrane protein assembly factor BamB
MKPAAPLIATLLLLNAIAFVETARAGDWPRFMGPNATGVVEQGEKVAKAWPGGGPKELWSIDVGYGFGGASIVGGKVYLLDRQGNDRDVFRVLDLKTGDSLWEQPYPTGGFRGGYSGSRGTPTIEGDRAFTVGVLGHITCFDLKGKRIAWSKSLSKDFGAKAGDWGFAQSPLVMGDLLVVSAAGGRSGLVALNKNTGATVWSTRSFGETDTYTSPMHVTIDEQDQIVMWHKEVIAGFDPKKGTPLWAYDWRTNRPIPQPVHVGNGKFFLTIGYGGGCAMIQVVKAARGPWSVREVFQDERSGSKVPPALYYKDHIYTNSDDNKRGLQCLDANGRVVWETGRRPAFGLGSMIIADGVIFIVSGGSGELVMAEASPKQYKELGRAKLLEGGDLFAPLALSNGMLLLRDTKQMKCVYVGDGSPVTRVDAAN